jgi:hypothetical protein
MPVYACGVCVHVYVWVCVCGGMYECKCVTIRICVQICLSGSKNSLREDAYRLMSILLGPTITDGWPLFMNFVCFLIDDLPFAVAPTLLLKLVAVALMHPQLATVQQQLTNTQSSTYASAKTSAHGDKLIDNLFFIASSLLTFYIDNDATDTHNANNNNDRAVQQALELVNDMFGLLLMLFVPLETITAYARKSNNPHTHNNSNSVSARMLEIVACVPTNKHTHKMDVFACVAAQSFPRLRTDEYLAALLKKFVSRTNTQQQGDEHGEGGGLLVTSSRFVSTEFVGVSGHTQTQSQTQSHTQSQSQSHAQEAEGQLFVDTHTSSSSSGGPSSASSRRRTHARYPSSASSAVQPTNTHNTHHTHNEESNSPGIAGRSPLGSVSLNDMDSLHTHTNTSSRHTNNKAPSLGSVGRQHSSPADTHYRHKHIQGQSSTHTHTNTHTSQYAQDVDDEFARYIPSWEDKQQQQTDTHKELTNSGRAKRSQSLDDTQFIAVNSPEASPNNSVNNSVNNSAKSQKSVGSSSLRVNVDGFGHTHVDTHANTHTNTHTNTRTNTQAHTHTGAHTDTRTTDIQAGLQYSNVGEKNSMDSLVNNYNSDSSLGSVSSVHRDRHSGHTQTNTQTNTHTNTHTNDSNVARALFADDGSDAHRQQQFANMNLSSASMEANTNTNTNKDRLSALKRGRTAQANTPTSAHTHQQTLDGTSNTSIVMDEQTSPVRRVSSLRSSRSRRQQQQQQQTQQTQETEEDYGMFANTPNTHTSSNQQRSRFASASADSNDDTNTNTNTGTNSYFMNTQALVGANPFTPSRQIPRDAEQTHTHSHTPSHTQSHTQAHTLSQNASYANDNYNANASVDTQYEDWKQLSHVQSPNRQSRQAVNTQRQGRFFEFNSTNTHTNTHTNTNNNNNNSDYDSDYADQRSVSSISSGHTNTNNNSYNSSSSNANTHTNSNSNNTNNLKQNIQKVSAYMNLNTHNAHNNSNLQMNVDEQLPPLSSANTQHSPKAAAAASAHTQQQGESGIANTNNECVYTHTDDIQPCKNPTRDLQRVFRGLETPEWPEIFDVLNVIRSLALHHPHTLTQTNTQTNTTNLTPVWKGVCKQMDNLRSAVAKNAMLTIADMFTGLGRVTTNTQTPTHTQTTMRCALDTTECLSAVMSALIKRSGDTRNGFLEESADNAMYAILTTPTNTQLLPAVHTQPVISPHRVLNSLLSLLDHRNVVIRGKISQYIVWVFQLCGHEFHTNNSTQNVKGANDVCLQTNEAFKTRLHKMIADSGSEVRLHARAIVCLCLCLSAAQSAHTPSAHTPKRTQQQGGLFTRGEMESVVGADNVDKSLVSSLINAVVCVHTQGSLDTLFGKTNSSASTSVNTSLSSFPATPGGASSGMRTPMSAHTPHSAAHTPHSTVHTPMSAHTPKSPSSRRVLTNNNSRKESHSLVFVDSDNDNDSFISNNNDGVSAASIISLSSVSMSTDSPHSHTHNNRPPPQQRTTKNQPPTPTQSATHTRRIMQSTDCLITLPDTLRLTTSKAWNERQTSLSTLTEIVGEYGEVLRDANKLETCVDAILCRLEDSSVKVCMSA